MRFPMNTYQYAQRKQFLSSVITRQLYFLRTQFLKLLQSKYFDTTIRYFSEGTISSEQLLFLRNSSFRTVASSQQLYFQNSYFFRATVLQRRHFQRSTSLGQLLFVGATVLERGWFRIQTFTDKLLFRSRYFCAASSFHEDLLFGKKNFSEEQYSTLPTFSGGLLFQSDYVFKKTLFSKAATSSEVPLFHDILFQKILDIEDIRRYFQKIPFFTGMLSFHKCSW